MFVVDRRALHIFPFSQRKNKILGRHVRVGGFGNPVTGEISGNTFLHVQTVELMENNPIDITKVNLY